MPRAHSSQDITRWQDGIPLVPAELLTLLVTSANCSFAVLYKIYLRKTIISHSFVALLYPRLDILLYCCFKVEAILATIH